MSSAGEISVHVTIDEEQVQEAARLAARLFRSEYASAIIAEEPVDEDGEAHSTVGNDPCVCLSEEPCRVHDDIEDVTEEPPVDTAPDVDPDEAVWTNDAQVDDDPDLESIVRAQLDGHGVECHGTVRITSARIARAAREHIEAEMHKCYAKEDATAHDRAEKAEAEVKRLTHLLGSHADGHRCTCEMTDPGVYHGENMHPPEWEQDPWCPTHPDMNVVTAEVKRLAALADNWRQQHKALRADVGSFFDGYGYANTILARDDERGKAQADRESFGGSGANAIERGCGEDFRRRFVAPTPDTVTLRRDDVESLLHCWSEEPDFGDADRDTTARVRASLGWGDDSECDHDWEPHDLPDPSSAGAVLQRGHICRDCGKVED